MTFFFFQHCFLKNLLFHTVFCFFCFFSICFLPHLFVSPSLLAGLSLSPLPSVFLYSSHPLSPLSTSSVALSVASSLSVPNSLTPSLARTFFVFSRFPSFFRCNGLPDLCRRACVCLCVRVCVCVCVCVRQSTPPLQFIIILSTATLIGSYHSPTWRAERRGWWRGGGLFARSTAWICTHGRAHTRTLTHTHRLTSAPFV